MKYTDLLSQTTIKKICLETGFKPRKKFGQNYLTSAGPIEKMITAANIQPTDIVVEVGPGFGVLTLAAAEKAKKVVAFEIEKSLEPYWEKVMTEHTSIEIVWGDVLKNFPTWVAEHTGPYKVVANLPYHMAARIIRMFLELENPPTEMVCMVQKEVGERMMVDAGDMNLLALSAQLFSTPEKVTLVKAGSFWPVPHVDSIVVHLKDIHTHAAHRKFFTIARAGFAFKRKMLAKNLMRVLNIPRDELEEYIAAVANGNMGARPQDLSTESWKKLVEMVTPYLSTE